MAITATQNSTDLAALLKTSPDAYVALGTLLSYNKPDNRDLLIETYGDQGITGFLELTGAVKNAGTADHVQYWEDGRLHKTVAISGGGGVDAGATGHFTVAGFTTGTDQPVRLNDVLLTPGGQRLVVVALDDSNEEIDVKRLDGENVVAEDSATTLIVIGNIYAQGTSQPTTFYQTDVLKRENPFFITKETYQVNGSQATNIGWIDANGQGDYRWYVKGEMDTRKRFLNQREMMMLFSDKENTANEGVALASGTITGSEGYFTAVEDRGITTTGDFDSMADIDSIILLLDKEGAPSEYAMYVNTQTGLNMDDMVASGIATATTAGLAGQFGSFQNDADMAVRLGFKSFTRGGYTFHKHDWKLLNDPTLLGAFGTPLFKGAMVPMTQVADAKTGKKSPALEMNFKSANGYNRELEHWVTGGGVLGFNTDGDDVAKFHYRSECNLITRAANKHVVLKS
tara:strand:+ start:205 stop:1572 length:1368 start_codon:yes stop_codon:yes gene_type:complete